MLPWGALCCKWVLRKSEDGWDQLPLHIKYFPHGKKCHRFMNTHPQPGPSVSASPLLPEANVQRTLIVSHLALWVKTTPSGFHPRPVSSKQDSLMLQSWSWAEDQTLCAWLTSSQMQDAVVQVVATICIFLIENLQKTPCAA